MSVSKIGFLSGLALSALLLATAQQVQAADSIWNGTASNDFTLGANWNPGLPAAGDAAQLSDAVAGLQHNLVMNSNLLPLGQRININKDVTAPYSITGTGTLQIGATNAAGFILSASDQNLTLDMATLNISRAALITAGDYTADPSDHGKGSIIIGSPSTAATMQFNIGASSATNSGQAVNFNAQFGTNITVYPTVNFVKATSSGGRSLALLATTGGTISLLGGVNGPTTTAARVIQVGSNTSKGTSDIPYDGTVVLGNSPAFLGAINVNSGTLVINANNSLGIGDGSGGGTEMPRAGSGALALSNNITTAAGQVIYLDTRIDYAPHMKNAGGVNTISGLVELEEGSLTPLPENIWTIQASGTSADELRFSGTIQSSAGEVSSNPQILALTGSGKGTIASGGSMIELNAHQYSVEKYDGGTWKYDAGSTISYTGTTHVLGGTLIVNTSHTTGGAYTVDGGAILGGSGTIGSAVNLSGAIAPGNSAGTLTVGSLSLLTGSSATMEMQNTSGGHAPGGGLSDLISVTGLLSASGTVTINASAVGGGLLGTGAVVSTWTLATYGSISGTPTFVVNGIAPGYTPSIDLTTPGQVNLVLTPVPEPSTFVLAGLGLVGLVVVRLRKRK